MLAKRVQVFSESVIREMTRLAQAHQAINLGQGMPDFPAPQIIKDAAIQAIQEDFNQYAITWGAPGLRRAIAEKMRRFNGIECDPETMITVCCGATECMMATMLATIDPGDEVIIFQPFYENYGPDALLTGATPRFVQLRPPGWGFDPDELRAAFNSKTRAIILNTPNNPTGHIFTHAELSLIAELCQEYDALAFADEIYEYIRYSDKPHLSIATLPGMADRTVTISGLSKTFSITGWRLGYCVASPELTTGIRKAHDFLTVGAPHPLQVAGAVAMGLPDSYYTSLCEGYRKRRELFLPYLHQAGFTVYEPEGAYYVMVDIRPLGFANDTAFVQQMIREIGVSAVPGSSFFSPKESGSHLVRFMFAKRDETLHAAGERLQRLRALRPTTVSGQ
ncbi:pyridoxal phosphate-dependent aminotransferase [Tuwongella immobilis]|uniref:Aminotransferase n=1 Tax=Tuwongella immobilis TaxID=692036 RepID=A0A6C2YHZ9_9BACT|nr:aminotransferase class I/II-fold pyridoxal phosphate-dependent enzyme [Tuwongella immobilis]VIP00889.1 aminotransferase : Aminotransferase class I and II OS=Cyanothece sp. (strain PCC 7822) GN=Cyan7822_1581 PE=3 SV=1: Aminotran_1_2 [Tuwongella immobilis]VTR97196.1 aminotransferase : Aminotransferase class I and II OS=Cyanothece sp. (strain PCC 7822) GN=Cyan7822_1581 PE=3 SV=1: Aminotran_1_2 [Tuwongella immobilis]